MTEEKKMSPFDLSKTILQKTEHMDHEEVRKIYSPFMMNRIFSNSQQTVFFANEMNQCWQLPPEMQYDFYYYGLPRINRYFPWPKKDKNLEFKIDLVKRRYNYSTLRAKEVIPLIDELDLWDEIEEYLSQGGAQTIKRRRKKKK